MLKLLTDAQFYGILTATLFQVPFLPSLSFLSTTTSQLSPAQDAPFLALRLYMLLALDIASQTLVFFTCKNCLVVLLQTYRLYVICTRIHEENRAFKSARNPSLFLPFLLPSPQGYRRKACPTWATSRSVEEF